MPSWAINLHHQLLEERERDAEPPGELRKGFPSRWTSKELSLSRSTSCLRPKYVRKNPLDCCFDCLEFVLVAQLLLDGHNTRDIGQGYYADALPLRGDRCTGAVSQLCTRVATPVSS